MRLYYWTKDSQEFELKKSSTGVMSPAEYAESCRKYNDQQVMSKLKLKDLQLYQSTNVLIRFLSLLLR